MTIAQPGDLRPGARYHHHIESASSRKPRTLSFAGAIADLDEGVGRLEIFRRSSTSGDDGIHGPPHRLLTP